MAIRIFIEYNNKIIQLPVNPPELAVKTNSNNSGVEIVKLGEINILRQAKLIELEIECFLPSDEYAPYVLTKGEFKNPKYYIDYFNVILKDRKPCRLIVTDTDINMLVSIESFEHSKKAGTDDEDYKLELKEYKPHSIKTVKIITTVPGTSTAPKTATASTAGTTRQPTSGQFSIGDTVIANGKYFQDSYGGGRHGTFKNFTGKISHKVTKTGRKLPYHITDTSGGWKGWVALSQIEHK